MPESLSILPPQPAAAHFSVAKAVSPTCGACRDGMEVPFGFSMAFQPIVDLQTRTVFAYEALVRGPEGQSAASVLGQVDATNIYAFDQSCRVKAITMAAQLGLADGGARLSVNFMPGAVYSPAACIRRTLTAAKYTGFPLSALIFEITEAERVRDTGNLQSIVTEYKKHGFTLALDDYGAGYSGPNLLADLDINLLKIDAGLIRDIDKRPRTEATVCSIVTLCRTLGVKVLGEAVETVAEMCVLQNCGISLMQGYLFARPAFEALPEVHWPMEAFAPLPELASTDVSEARHA